MLRLLSGVGGMMVWGGASVRLPVPGPVWGARPVREEPDEDEGGRVAARRGGWSGWWADGVRRLLRADARSVAKQAVAVALAAAASRQDADRVQRWRDARTQLVMQGLTPATVATTLGTIGAELARTTGWVPRWNQYESAAWLLGQRLVELDTGEGKSVALALAAAVAAWSGAPVHVLTANSYLAGRDAAAFAPFYAALGLQVAAVADDDAEPARRAAWCADVVYASARTLGFDVLRDDTRGRTAPFLSRGLCVVFIDEADSVLVDEARTPLVIAQTRKDPQERARAWRALDWARRLDWGPDAECMGANHTVRLTDRGRAALAAMVARESAGVTFLGTRHQVEWVEQAMLALHRLQRDVDYMVREREIVLIDACTGRPDPGRTLARALHTLVALKEGLPVPEATETQASLTYPRLFARYHHVAGTSGTLTEAAAELRRHYGLVVCRVPRVRPSRRVRYPMRLFATREGQFLAAVSRARAMAAQGRSVLLATDSVADSMALAERFASAGVPVAVLDARHDGAEHALVVRAGAPGCITVSTQMAGRGTDIPIDPAVARRGGLHVLILQHNRSRRIDRQVAGRAARQGDPGSIEHWIRWYDSPLSSAERPFGSRQLTQCLSWCLIKAPRGIVHHVLPGVWWAYQFGWRRNDGIVRRESLVQDHDWARRLHFTKRVPSGGDLGR